MHNPDHDFSLPTVTFLRQFTYSYNNFLSFRKEKHKVDNEWEIDRWLW